MAHEVETMMYAGAIPWHGLGVAVPRNVTWEHALELGGLAWEVELRALALTDTERTAAPGLERWRAVTRITDDTVLSVVTESYRPIQNRTAFSLFERVFGAAAVLHTAGALKGGRVIWGLAEFPEPLAVAGEAHRRFLLMTTAHDASGALVATPVATRVVCANTLGCALGEKQVLSLTVQHRGDTERTVREAGDVLRRYLAMYQRYAKIGDTLALTTLPERDRQTFLEQWFPGDTREHPTVKTRRERIAHLADHGTGNAPHRGTAYGLLQGVTEYIDHETRASKSPHVSRRFAYQTLGAGADVKERALTDLVAYAQAA
jgi:phage/plasmid-like protein (TIGR03299 family)